MRPDTDFDGIAASFEEEVYGSSKGYVRFNVLWEDMLSEVPRIKEGNLSVLDAGGGAGRMALGLARLGNDVVLCDPSREMLRRAEESVREADLSGSVTTVHASVQNLRGSVGEEFDVIACHAVLEWLADPEATLGQLVGFLKKDGRLSLMFYNRNAALLKTVLRGRFAAALQEHEEGLSPGGRNNGATPLAEEVVRGWLDKLGLRVRSRAGIRIFHDHLPSGARDRENLDGLLKVEKELRKQEPFASLGQHTHLICEWAR